MTTDLIEHTNELRNTTDLELQDDLADHRVDVNMLKEDGLRDIDRLFDQKLEDFRESAAGIVESIEDQTLGVYDAARERLDAFVEREKAALAKERAQLEMERRKIRDVGRATNAGEVKRAASAPVGW
jgi:F0F1-type ATP synthase membrane subunit b/b'